MTHYADDMATGPGQPLLPILGRIRQGAEAQYVILEEPGESVLVHFDGTLRPHFRRDCPYCTETSTTKPMWYMGAATLTGDFGILELTEKCHSTAEAAARNLPASGPYLADEESPLLFAGLLVKISRADFARSPRVLRSNQRVSTSRAWTYRTREELARIWGIPVRPRCFKEGETA